MSQSWDIVCVCVFLYLCVYCMHLRPLAKRLNNIQHEDPSALSDIFLAAWLVGVEAAEGFQVEYSQGQSEGSGGSWWSKTSRTPIRERDGGRSDGYTEEKEGRGWWIEGRRTANGIKLGDGRKEEIMKREGRMDWYRERLREVVDGLELKMERGWRDVSKKERMWRVQEKSLPICAETTGRT